MPLLTSDGVMLWTARRASLRPAAADDPPVVLVHGGPGLWDMSDDLVPLLGGTGGLAVCRWDQRGCGRSDRGVDPRSMSEALDDLVPFLS
jgi:proline iminopeptidase